MGEFVVLLEKKCQEYFLLEVVSQFDKVLQYSKNFKSIMLT